MRYHMYRDTLTYKDAQGFHAYFNIRSQRNRVSVRSIRTLTEELPIPSLLSWPPLCLLLLICSLGPKSVAHTSHSLSLFLVVVLCRTQSVWMEMAGGGLFCTVTPMIQPTHVHLGPLEASTFFGLDIKKPNSNPSSSSPCLLWTPSGCVMALSRITQAKPSWVSPLDTKS